MQQTTANTHDVERGVNNTDGTLQGDVDKSETPVMLDWDGPNDDANPLNWNTFKKIHHAAVPILFSSVITYSSTAYTPATDLIAAHFHIGQTTALLGYSLYTLALGFGPVIAAPISETYGRRAVYMLSIPIFGLFILGAGFAKDYATVCICRFFAGIFGSPAIAIGAGTIVDLFEPKSRGLPMTMLAVMAFAGSSIGPVIGGFAVQEKGWRWSQWTVLFIAVAFYGCALGTKETYKKAILSARAKKNGLPATPTPPLKTLLTITLVRPTHMLVVEPIVLFVTIYVAFVFAVLYGLFAALPIVFPEVYGFDVGQSGLVFIAVLVGTLLGGCTYVAIDRLVYQRISQRFVKSGKGPVPPEYRLVSMMFGSILVVISLFWFAWTARPTIHWICPVLATLPFAWGNLCLFIPAIVYLSEVYGAAYAASAAAANNLGRYILGTAFPLFIPQMFDNLGVGWATSTFGFISVALLPVPWVLYRWGSEIRSRSQYITGS